MAAEELNDAPLAEESELEEESPYRRRARAVTLRRERRSRLRLLRWAVGGVLILSAATYGGYRLAVFMLSSPRFLLTSADDVVLSGNQYVTRDEVMNALGLPLAGALERGVNILRLSLEEKRKQVESIPWVRTATLTRAYPNRLAVNLVERTPVAFINVDGRVKLVDGEGVILEKPERASFNFPVVTGLESASSRPDRLVRLGLYSAFLREVANEASGAGWVISEVDLADADDLKAMLVRGRESLQLHFGHEAFVSRFHNFLTLLPELRKSGNRIDSIDLRYGNQIVVSPRSDTPPQESWPAAPPRGLREN